jgi:hypothetical protein
MLKQLLITLHLVVLHSVDGHEVIINPAQVTSLIAAKEGRDNELYTNEVRCVVGMTDGKFLTVGERCDAVKQLLEGAHD